jgi:hypothetical protein
MAISTAFCSSFKQGLMQGLHNFSNPGGNIFKIALYTSDATLGASTTAYSSTNEVIGYKYIAGGNVLSSVTPTTSGTTAFVDFSDSTWASSTITANGALIYNLSSSNASCVVLAFGSDKSSTNGDFTIVFPTANASSAIIRIS